MQGSINFDGTLSGSIAGGGGGGSEVTITPTLQSGTKIADYSIDGTNGSLYAPTPEDPPQLPANIVTKVQRQYNDTTQTKIVTVTTLDTSNNQSVSQDIYAPSPPIIKYIEEPGLSEDIQIGSLQVGGDSTPIYIPSSGGGGSWDYSTTEVNTGQKWIDGKDIYCKVFDLTIPNQSGAVTFSSATPGLNEVIDVRYSVNGKGPVYATPWYSQASVYFDSMDASGIYFYFQSNYNSGRPLRAIAFYTKN